jgi:pseudaminic acid biosynthesis-associated methylase
MTTAEAGSDTKRLESLWAGEFGDEYIARNAQAGAKRQAFWQAFVEEFAPRSVLEVGCNIGGNLTRLAEAMEPANLFGVDINQQALERLQAELPGINLGRGVARELPFANSCVDAVFTIGVLIHQPEDSLPTVMGEMVRCSRRYILCGEYWAETTEEIAYRGHDGALFKRDYGRILMSLFPQLILRKQGVLTHDDGFDDLTYWVFQKPE